MLRWIAAEHGAAWGLDPAASWSAAIRPAANLAAGLALSLRDGPAPLPLRGLLLNYGVFDSRLDTPSYREFATGYGLTEEKMRFYWEAYAPRPADRLNPLAAPLRADLTGLPPCLLHIAELDVLAGENHAMDARLRAAGVAVETTLFPRHGAWLPAGGRPGGGGGPVGGGGGGLAQGALRLSALHRQGARAVAGQRRAGRPGGGAEAEAGPVVRLARQGEQAGAAEASGGGLGQQRRHHRRRLAAAAGGRVQGDVVQVQAIRSRQPAEHRVERRRRQPGPGMGDGIAKDGIAKAGQHPAEAGGQGQAVGEDRGGFRVAGVQPIGQGEDLGQVGCGHRAPAHGPGIARMGPINSAQIRNFG